MGRLTQPKSRAIPRREEAPSDIQMQLRKVGFGCSDRNTRSVAEAEGRWPRGHASVADAYLPTQLPGDRRWPVDLCLQRNQLVGDGEQRQFQTGGNAGLVEDIRQVPLHGLFADAELLGDITIAATLDDATDHFQFTWG
jgi:hypothetical protein